MRYHRKLTSNSASYAKSCNTSKFSSEEKQYLRTLRLSKTRTCSRSLIRFTISKALSRKIWSSIQTRPHRLPLFLDLWPTGACRKCSVVKFLCAFSFSITWKARWEKLEWVSSKHMDKTNQRLNLEISLKIFLTRWWSVSLKTKNF